MFNNLYDLPFLVIKSSMRKNKWRNRFRKNGLNAMDDLPRAGKPPVISAETKASVIDLSYSRAEDGCTNWSQKRIGEHSGISQSKVGTILAEAELKSRKTDYWCGKSTDPEFTEKMTSIVGPYMEPPDNALVICVDEKTQIQALDRTQPLLPLKPGKPKRLTATYKRNGIVSLFAALSVHIGKTEEKANGDSFLKFLKGIAKKYKTKTTTCHPRQSFHPQENRCSRLARIKKEYFLPLYTNLFILAQSN